MIRYPHSTEKPLHKHHIIPKYAGGSDDPENLIELSKDHHFLVHWWYYRMWGNWQDLMASFFTSGHSREACSLAGTRGIKKAWETINSLRESSPEYNQKFLSRARKNREVGGRRGREVIAKRLQEDENFRSQKRDHGKRLGEKYGKVVGEWRNEKIANDPEYKAKCLEGSRKGAEALKEKRRQDPEFDAKFRTNSGKASRGKMWITDGTDNRMIYPSEPIPEGWRRGMAQRRRVK